MATLTALAVAVLSVAFGAVLVFVVPRQAERVLAAVRLAALVAAVAVVGLQLLPHSFAEIRWWMFLPLVLAFAIPLAIERAGRQRELSATLLADEIAYAGLLVHSAIDGAALESYADELGVLVALAAHTVPIAALVTVRFETLRGRTAGLIRAAGLAVATVVGVLLTSVIPDTTVESIEPWMDAAVAGLLLHIALHSLSRHDHDHTH